MFAAPLKKNKLGRGRSTSNLIPSSPGKHGTSVAGRATNNVRPDAMFGSWEERKPAVTIDNASSARAGFGGAASTACDVVSIGAMAKLWESVPSFEPDTESFDPETLFSGMR